MPNLKISENKMLNFVDTQTFINFGFAVSFVYFEACVHVYTCFHRCQALGISVQGRGWPCGRGYGAYLVQDTLASLHYTLSPAPTDCCREQPWMLACSPHKFILKSICMLKNISIRNISTRRFQKKCQPPVEFMYTCELNQVLLMATKKAIKQKQ